MSEEKYNLVKRSKKEIIINNFIGGISWGIGVTVGLAFFIGVLTIIASNINFVPIFGDFIANVINYVITKNPSNL